MSPEYELKLRRSCASTRKKTASVSVLTGSAKSFLGGWMQDFDVLIFCFVSSNDYLSTSYGSISKLISSLLPFFVTAFQCYKLF
jgi:hypothetical protein